MLPGSGPGRCEIGPKEWGIFNGIADPVGRFIKRADGVVLAILEVGIDFCFRGIWREAFWRPPDGLAAQGHLQIGIIGPGVGSQRQESAHVQVQVGRPINPSPDRSPTWNAIHRFIGDRVTDRAGHSYFIAGHHI